MPVSGVGGRTSREARRERGPADAGMMLQASPMAGRLSPSLSTSPSLLSADELQRTLTSVGDDGASWQLTRSPSSRSNLATSWLGMSGGHAPESPSRRLGLSHGIFDEDRRLNKKPTSKVGVSWQELQTDPLGSWNQPKANQIDTRCEAMRHVQSTLPAGNTAAERKAESRRLASQPARRARGLAMYAVPEPSRFALAGSIPQSHDLFYQKSAMPVSASMLSTH